jgi:hypothetical protein
MEKTNAYRIYVGKILKNIHLDVQDGEMNLKRDRL